MTDNQEPCHTTNQESTTHGLHSADSNRLPCAQNSVEQQMRNPVKVVLTGAESSVSNMASCASHPLPSQPSYLQPIPSVAATNVRPQHTTTERVMSSSTSDVTVADRRAPGTSVPRAPSACLSAPPPPVQQWSQSLTRGGTRQQGWYTDQPVGVLTTGTSMASSVPSIPRECCQQDAQFGAEPVISTKQWLDSLHRQKNVLPISKSTDRMFPVSMNPGLVDRHPLNGSATGLDPLRRRSAEDHPLPSRSTWTESDESLASAAASSRQSLTSRGSGSSRGAHEARSDSFASSKKRRVRFELQPTSPVPDERQRPKYDKREVADRPYENDPFTRGSDDTRKTSRSSGSLFSKFRRVVVDGVGSLFSSSKQKGHVDDPAESQSASSGPLPANSFDNMTEMERLASVADRIASERLHSAVLHGKLPSDPAYKNGYASHYRSEPSRSDQELNNIEACFAGLSLSTTPVRPLADQLPNRKQQNFAPWCTNKSSSVSEELCHLTSNACSSYVQFIPKSMTVPCSMACASPRGTKSPPVESSGSDAAAVQCQCGNMTTSDPALPATLSQPSSRLNSAQATSNPYAEPSPVFKSFSQPTTLNSQGQLWQCSSVSAASNKDPQVHRSASNSCGVTQKPQPPPKNILLRSSGSAFREGLLPGGAEDRFRIRRQTSAVGHGTRTGPMRSAGPFFLADSRPTSNVCDASVTNPSRPVPPAPPIRSVAAANNSSAASSELDADSHGLTLQELSAMIDRELQANERLEINSAEDIANYQQLDSLADHKTTSNHADVATVLPDSESSTSSLQQADIDAQLKSLGFDEALWNLQELDDILTRDHSVGKKKLDISDDDEEEDSASTLTDWSGSVVTVTSMPGNVRSTSPTPSDDDDRLSTLDHVDSASLCGVEESTLSSRVAKPYLLGTSPSYSMSALPGISRGSGAHSRLSQSGYLRSSSTNIPVSRTCREDSREHWRLHANGPMAAFSFGKLATRTPAPTACSPYNSNSSGIGSLLDSSSVPNSPM